MDGPKMVWWAEDDFRAEQCEWSGAEAPITQLPEAEMVRWSGGCWEADTG